MAESAAPRSAALPAWRTSFVGRERELDRIGEALAGERVVTLTGPGGYGKTRLAREAAAGPAGRRQGGVRWADLASTLARPSVVAYAVARAFGLVEEVNRPLVTTICDHLASADALLVLDHCDGLAQPSARLVEALVEATGALRILVTSREPLGVPHEYVCPVRSLDAEAAHRLFLDRASRVRPGYRAEGEEFEAVAEVCRHVDGAPLAIELAAARVRTMAAARIATGLADWSGARTVHRRTVLPAPNPVEAAVAWSHHLLAETDRVVLRRLSVFAGGCTFDAARAVCAGGDVVRDAVAPALSGLVDHGFADRAEEPDRDEGRYRLAETIRRVADAELMAAGEAHATRDRHRDYFVALAERAEPELVGEDGPRWLDRLERDQHNLLAAADWCEASGNDELLLRLLTALALFFELRSHLHAGGQWFDRALARKLPPSSLRARALCGAARLALYRGDLETLGRYGPEALTMAEEIGDEAALSRALSINGAAAAWLTANVDRGRAMLERSAELGRKLRDDWALAEGLRLSSFAWMLQGDYHGGARQLAEFGRVAERLGNRFLIAWYRTIVGWARMQRGDFARAERTLALALEEDRELGGVANAGIAVVLLGEVEALTGRYEDAESRLVPFLRKAAATRNYLAAPWGVPILARLRVGRGRPADARKMLEPFLEQLRPLGVPLHVANALSVLGAAHLALGDAPAAEAALTEARSVAVAINNPWLTAHADHHLGELARRRGDGVRAANFHTGALVERARVGLRPGVAESLEALAGLAGDRELFVDAARLFSAAAALRRGMGLARWPADQANYDRDLTLARRALGEPSFQSAWAEGAAIGFDEAVAYACSVAADNGPEGREPG